MYQIIPYLALAIIGGGWCCRSFGKNKDEIITYGTGDQLYIEVEHEHLPLYDPKGVLEVRKSLQNNKSYDIVLNLGIYEVNLTIYFTVINLTDADNNYIYYSSVTYDGRKFNNTMFQLYFGGPNEEPKNKSYHYKINWKNSEENQIPSIPTYEVGSQREYNCLRTKEPNTLKWSQHTEPFDTGIGISEMVIDTNNITKLNIKMTVEEFDNTTTIQCSNKSIEKMTIKPQFNRSGCKDRNFNIYNVSDGFPPEQCRSKDTTILELDKNCIYVKKKITTNLTKEQANNTKIICVTLNCTTINNERNCTRLIKNRAHLLYAEPEVFPDQPVSIGMPITGCIGIAIFISLIWIYGRKRCIQRAQERNMDQIQYVDLQLEGSSALRKMDSSHDNRTIMQTKAAGAREDEVLYSEIMGVIEPN